MEVKTFRARSMQEALQLVRRTLGADATLLQAREVRSGLFGWLPGAQQVEVLASADVQVPCRLPSGGERIVAGRALPPAGLPAAAGRLDIPPESRSLEGDFRARFRAAIHADSAEPPSLVEELSRPQPRPPVPHLPEAAFRLFTDLIDAEIQEDLARELIDRVCQAAGPRDRTDPLVLKARLARMLEEEIRVCGPIVVRPGETRIVAVVGPTGVGKTTTVAKLAANYRLREHRRVGLITVDTYRIAAVEQLRTYADIIDLPMEVVATPRELRAAIDRLSGLELILIDTAGRSPRDELKIQELKSVLAECRADEVHLVLSCVSGGLCLRRTAAQFATLGVTALLLTKLDEAAALGGLLPLLRNARLPISYLTHGQNVPDDIEVAEVRKLARIMLGVDSAA
jgi:flagellar biosynthesis protein FlhF